MKPLVYALLACLLLPSCQSLSRDPQVEIATPLGDITAEISICIGPQPELDFGGRRNPDGQGFAVFGRVIDGMEVVRRIQKLPETGQHLGREVPIESVKRTSR